MDVDALTFSSHCSPDADDYVASEARLGGLLVTLLGVLELGVIVGAAARYFAPYWRTKTYESLTGASP